MKKKTLVKFLIISIIILIVSTSLIYFNKNYEITKKDQRDKDGKLTFQLTNTEHCNSTNDKICYLMINEPNPSYFKEILFYDETKLVIR